MKKRRQNMPDKIAGKDPEKDKWIEIVLSAAPQFTEALSNFLTEMGTKGVFQEEILEEARNVLDESAQCEEIKAYIAAGPAGDKKIVALKKYIDSLADIFPEMEKPVFKSQVISDPDWGEQWKKYF